MEENTSLTKEIATYKGQATKVAGYAGSLTVVTQADYENALEEGKKIKDILSKVETRREEITKPLNAALKSARELFKPVEASLGDALATIRSKMTTFHNAQLAEAREKEAAIARKVEAGRMKPETAVRKMETVATPEKTVATEKASATMRTVQKWRVVDKAAIPLEFMEPDMVRIRASFKTGKPITGVEQYEESELAIS